MNGHEWIDKIELIVSCLTDMVYADVKYIDNNLNSEDVEVVITECKYRFLDLGVSARIVYADGYFSRVMM